MDAGTLNAAASNYGIVGAILLFIIYKAIEDFFYTKRTKQRDLTNQQVLESINQSISQMVDDISDKENSIKKSFEKHVQEEEKKFDTIINKVDNVTNNQIEQGYLIKELQHSNHAIENNTQAMNGLKEEMAQNRAVYQKIEFMMEHFKEVMDHFRQDIKEQKQQLQEIDNKISSTAA